MKIIKYDFIYLRSYLVRTLTMSDKIQTLYRECFLLPPILRMNIRKAHDAMNYDLEGKLCRIDSIYTSLVLSLRTILENETLYIKYKDQLANEVNAIFNARFNAQDASSVVIDESILKHLNACLDECTKKIISSHKSAQEHIPNILSLTGCIEDEFEREYVFDMNPELRTEMYTVKALKMLKKYLFNL